MIAALEGSQREVYTGAIGFASPHAGLELNVAIRTLEIAGGRAWLGCGGGIVADSDPRAELREALGKARADRRARSARACPARRPGAPGRPAAVAAPPRPRARPARDDRGPRRRARRAPTPTSRASRASARELYGLELARVALAAGAARRAACACCCRAGGAVAVEAHAEPAGADRVALEPRALAGGLGPHKWLDRPQEPPGSSSTSTASVLEAAWANVWIEPLDGALAHAARRRPHPPRGHPRRLLAAPHLRRPRGAALAATTSTRARAIFLTSSIRLATPAGLAAEPPRRRARG